jgi:FtsH-binding integral membrane protein
VRTLSTLVAIAFFVVVIIVPVYAQNEPVGSVVDLNSLFRSILSALVAGLVISLLGYFKSTDPKGFVAQKLITTLLISVCISLLMVALGWDFNTVEQWLASSALTIWIYWIAKIFGKFAISKRKHMSTGTQKPL